MTARLALPLRLFLERRGGFGRRLAAMIAPMKWHTILFTKFLPSSTATRVCPLSRSSTCQAS